MTQGNDSTSFTNQVVGTTSDDQIITDENDAVEHDKINGNAGSDTIATGDGTDLAAGDMVGNEWQFVDGKWTYNPAAIVDNGDSAHIAYDDVISTGNGDDVLLGNGGDDELYGGAGADTINAGRDSDTAYGGDGDDIVNLEWGADTGEGGAGADTVNAGDDDDLVYGDFQNDNLLQVSEASKVATTFSQFADAGDWTVNQDGLMTMTQTIPTDAAETYTISFELAANMGNGATSGSVEVLWNGEVVGEVTVETGVYEKHEIEVPGLGGDGELTFREVSGSATTSVDIDTSGPIFSYDKTMTFGDQDVDVAAFAPGQAKLYQVINGQLNVFDPATETYEAVGDGTGLGVNAVGFNVEDDMIYGIAKVAGTDALGNPVSVSDLVAMDAEGNAYRVGDSPVADFVGDFDDSGNLWTFDSSLGRATMIDVDNLDANGDPVAINYDLPADLMTGNVYDLAYNSDENVFYAVQAPNTNGGQGAVHRIDISEVPNGGEASISSLPITGTIMDDGIDPGMARGAYGAVFMDGDGNLYYGLNKGDHDLDGSTGVSGGIYKVNMDWEGGAAVSEFMADAPTTGRNDGAVDPRSTDAFAEIDVTTDVLIRNPEVAPQSGGDDDLRGGDGNDEMYGGGGDDLMHGGNDDDMLMGDSGNDKAFGGQGDDVVQGGFGADTIAGGDGSDQLSGGDGNDFASGGAGDDLVQGGAGADKLIGGAGSDTIESGAGNDHMWGGNWSADGGQDTFIVSAGGGKDMIHDFEANHDIIDLSSYGIDYDDLQGIMTDKGWATEIDLSQLTGGEANDKILLKAVDPDELDESNFLL